MPRMAAAQAPCLEARDLAVTFGTRAVLDGVDFAVRAGEVAVIEGPSGGGKSTLLRSLALLQDVSRGELRLGGVSAAAIAPSTYRQRVAYVPQTPVMFAGTVGDNVRAGPRLRGEELSGEAVASLLRRVGLDPSSAALGAQDLSGGEKQRVAVARAVANEPEAILFDEPTSALDPESAAVVLDLVRRCAEDARAVVLVTHSREQADALECTRYTCEGGHLSRRTPS